MELISQINNLMRQLVYSNIKYNIDSVKLKSFLNEEYEFIYERTLEEFQITYNLIKKDKMHFNEIRYTKVVVHFMFIFLLSKFINNQNKLKAQQIFLKLKESEKNLNCFLDNIYLFDNEINYIEI